MGRLHECTGGSGGDLYMKLSYLPSTPCHHGCAGGQVWEGHLTAPEAAAVTFVSFCSDEAIASFPASISSCRHAPFWQGETQEVRDTLDPAGEECRHPSHPTSGTQFGMWPDRRLYGNTGQLYSCTLPNQSSCHAWGRCLCIFRSKWLPCSLPNLSSMYTPLGILNEASWPQQLMWPTPS